MRLVLTILVIAGVFIALSAWPDDVASQRTVRALCIFGGPLVIAAGYAFVYWFARRGGIPKQPVSRPNTEQELKAELERIHRDVYSKYLDQYHQLLLWACGGTFAVSFGALQVFQGQGQNAPPIGAVGYLFCCWLLLVADVLVIMFYPYSSTRLVVQAKEALKASFSNNEAKALLERKKSENWGKLNKWFNEGAYVVLALAFWYLGVFVCLNFFRA
jgi:hypothetical protein